jgi:hypothetical protein
MDARKRYQVHEGVNMWTVQARVRCFEGGVQCAASGAVG